MKKKTLLITSILALVVVGTVALAQTDMLQGRFSLFNKFDPLKIFLYKNRYVSVVVSPVTSVLTSEVSSELVSEVTSTVGTSEVTSKVPSEVTSEVPSAVTSPVASAMAVSLEWAEKAKEYSIKQLTKTILENAAKEDYKTNPSKYILSDEQIERILNMYENSKS